MPELSRDGDSSAVKARRLALEVLARREHSVWELRRKLNVRGYPSSLIETVLEDLRGENLQSDQRFTESYIRSRAARGFGPYRIAAELKERGIDDTLIADCLKQGIDDWGYRAAEVRRKRFGKVLPDSPRERARQLRFLQYRGFTHEQANGVLKNRADG